MSIPHQYKFMKYFYLLLLLLAMPIFLQAQENVELDATLTYADSGCNDIWGWWKDGREYAIVGKQNGTSVVDITETGFAEELYFIPGSYSTWRDMKTYNNHAYIVDDQAGEGLIIIDLNDAPNSFTHTTWQTPVDGQQIQTCHNIFIEEATGFAYLFGCNNFNQGQIDGAVVLDLKGDPKNPTVAGIYNTQYIHDGYVRNDTMYSSEINVGHFAVVDFTDKSNPIVLATKPTSGTFTHNCWLSDDGNTLFTTDEITNGFVDAYSVGDLNDIQLLDKVQSSPGQQTTPHNAFAMGNWLITSWYTDGLVIHDISDPENLVEVGHYDSSNVFDGPGFNGAWGAYPYLPSGRIIVSDIQTGLWVFEPNYVEAARCKVKVVDATTGNDIANAIIDVLDSDISEQTNIFGEAEFGGGTPTVFDIAVGALGYESTFYSDIAIELAQTTEITVELTPSQSLNVSGFVVNGSLQVAEAKIIFESLSQTLEFEADGSGTFIIESIPSNTYKVYVGKWGYRTELFPQKYFSGDEEHFEVYDISRGLYDDFLFENSWELISESGAGNWEIGVPEATASEIISNPLGDAPEDYGKNCLVTGAAAGNGAGAFDVDAGATVVQSPNFNLSGMAEPTLGFYRWFSNSGGFGGAPNDTLSITLDNGSTSVVVYEVRSDDENLGKWVFDEVAVEDFLSASATMTVTLRVVDQENSGHLSEGGFDFFRAYDKAAPVDFGGFIVDENGENIGNAAITVNSDDTGNSYNGFSSNNGSYDLEVADGVYDITVSQWGYITQTFTGVTIDHMADRQNFVLQTGYVDDFEADLGWESNGDQGAWVIGAPQETSQGGTVYNPGADDEIDEGLQCYLTGNDATDANSDDVDPGTESVLTSPALDLSSYENPRMKMSYWWATDDTGDDASLQIQLVQGGSVRNVLNIDADAGSQSSWNEIDVKVKDYADFSEEFEIRVIASDGATDAIVEAGIDAFSIYDSADDGLTALEETRLEMLSVSPNPFEDSFQIDLQAGQEISRIRMYDVLGSMVFETEKANTQIAVPTLPSGLYLVEMETKDGDLLKSKILKK